MHKEDVVDTHTYTHTHTHTEILLSHKKKKFGTGNNMDGLGGHYAKGNKSDKDKYSIKSLTCKI